MAVCGTTSAGCDILLGIDSLVPDRDENQGPCGDAGQVKAFPTAEGFGAKSVGGRGGRVIEVTTLADHGEGTLRACIEATGPRTCVFRVGGTIALDSPLSVYPDHSLLTIAGQTAPGAGVQLKNYYLAISNGAHDVVVRHLRIRQGTDHAPQDLIAGCGGIVITGAEDTPSRNIIVDHASVSWTCSAALQVRSHVVDTTIQWSLLGEPLMPNTTA